MTSTGIKRARPPGARSFRNRSASTMRVRGPPSARVYSFPLGEIHKQLVSDNLLLPDGIVRSFAMAKLAHKAALSDSSFVTCDAERNLLPL